MNTTRMCGWAIAGTVLLLGACATGNQVDQAAMTRTSVLDEAAAAPLDDAARQVAAMDANGDGRLTQTEQANGARAMFVKMDVNHDDLVTPDEMDAMQSAAKALSTPGRMPLTSEQKIAVIDRDGDGKLSAAEHAGGTLMVFDRMDVDVDGYLTVAELRAGHEAMLTAPEQRTAGAEE